MRGKRRRDDGWDEDRQDRYDDRRDPWPYDSAYGAEAPAARPAAGYAKGIPYAGQDEYGRQAPGAVQGPGGRGYEAWGPEPSGNGGAPPGFSGAGPQPAAPTREEPGYAGPGYPGTDYAPVGRPGGGYGGGARPGYGGYGAGTPPDQVNGAPGRSIGRFPEPAATAQYGQQSPAAGPEFLTAGGPASANGNGAGTARPYARLTIFTLLDDKAAEFDRLAERAAEGVRKAEPDTLVYVIHVVPKAPMQRILYEIYRDHAAFDSHEQQSHVQRFAEDRRSCVIATNAIDLRLKYAKVATLGTPQAPPVPAPGPGAPAAAAPSGANGQRQAGGANGQYPAAGNGRPRVGGQYPEPASGRQLDGGRAARFQPADQDQDAYRAGRYGGR